MEPVEIIQAAIDSVYDALEIVYADFTIAVGKQLLYVLICCGALLVLSLLMLFLNLPAFITWQESLGATIVVGIVYSIKFISSSSVNRYTDKLKEIKSLVKQTAVNLNKPLNGEDDSNDD